MPPKKMISMRQLARAIGVSLATVSDSLRGDKRVNSKTRDWVCQAAAELGYVYNPMAGSVMSEIRRSSVGNFRGTVAVVDFESPAVRPIGASNYHRLVLEGAIDAAKRLGFNVDFFNAPISELSIKRLDDILRSRGSGAVLILPMLGKPNVSALSWGRLTGVYTDYLIDAPPLNRISPDHFKYMILVMKKLASPGYKRPGLVMHGQNSERTMYRLESAFDAYWKHFGLGSSIEHLIYQELS
jgi:LacI family transcriptional regulator